MEANLRRSPLSSGALSITVAIVYWRILRPIRSQELLGKYRMLREVRIVRIVSTGTGSKRITIPKRMLDAVLGDDEYAAVSMERGRIIVRPIKVQVKSSRILRGESK